MVILFICISNGNICLQPLIKTAILLLSSYFIVYAFSIGALSSQEYNTREQYIQGYLNHLFYCIISACVLHCHLCRSFFDSLFKMKWL